MLVYPSFFRIFVLPMKRRQGIITLLAFAVAFSFFQFAYPYHLIRREQQNLFLFDGDYIGQTYRGTGWLARFVSDFLEQFFHLPVAGPLIVAMLLMGIGVVTYRICRHFLGRWPSLSVAALLYIWSFLRETGNLYTTRYTVVVLGFLSLVLLALQCRKAWLRPIAAVALLAFGAWALGAPVHKHYGKPWSVPKFAYERLIGLDAEAARERWDKVLKLSEKDLYMVEASYFYNLARAMRGELGDRLFDHSQHGDATLLLRVGTDRTTFTNCVAGEAWFQLGQMTIAEQSAIISLQASPKHTGARYIVRLARVNLISGEDAAAQKYLNLLSTTLFYRRWALDRMPGRQDGQIRAQLVQARANLPRKDFVHNSTQTRELLLSLLEANPSNTLARDYLLCHDLLTYDLDTFIQDYMPDRIPARNYQEAVLIWLSQHDRLNPQEVARFGVDVSQVDRMGRFGRSPDRYRNTYWYYYMDALLSEDTP